MEILTSWDDGCEEDFKIAELLRQYDLPAIFFIPSCTLLTESDIQALGEDFLIGGHTVSHPPDMKLLDVETAFMEASVNRTWLQEVTGQEVEWFCYPKGKHNETTIEQIKKAGFKFARTTNVGITKRSDNPYRIDTTVHVLRHRKEVIPKDWLVNAKEQFTIAKKDGDSVYHLWGHGWEVERYQLWDELEQLFKFIYEQRD